MDGTFFRVVLEELKTWGERRGSNPRHLGPQPSALPAELRPPCAVRAILPFPQGDSAPDFGLQ